MNKSLGLIETEGLAAGVEAADAAVKSANVELIGYELTKGGGWTTVKIQGDVGAVKAAVDAARMAAAKVNRVVSTRVIPRPSAGLDVLVYNPDTVGVVSEKTDTPKPPTPPDHPNKVKEEEELPQPDETPIPEVTAENPEATTTDRTEKSAENPDAEKVGSTQESEEKSADVQITESVEANSDVSEHASADEPDKTFEQQEADTENPDIPNAEKEDAPVAAKPARRTAAKGRKGGKRSNKHDATE